MRTVTLLACIASASTALAACAAGPVVGGGGRYAFGYDGFYNGAYGPFLDGYWGGDGAFYFRHAAGEAFTRDGGRNFIHGRADGFAPFHVRRPG